MVAIIAHRRTMGLAGPLGLRTAKVEEFDPAQSQHIEDFSGFPRMQNQFFRPESLATPMFSFTCSVLALAIIALSIVFLLVSLFM